MEKKEVVYPIKVPAGKYCWEYLADGNCDFFDNEGGHSHCTLGFWKVKDTKKGVEKAPECAALKDMPKEAEVVSVNTTSYIELKNIADHIGDCIDLGAILSSHVEDILERLQLLTDEELEEEKELYGYEE